jgi:hypothetical protein
MTARRILAGLVVVVVGCKSSHEPPPPPPSPGSGTAAAPTMVPADGAPAEAETLKDHMRAHFAAVSELQRAIARGHLDEARALASWIGDHDETLLEGWQPYVDELRAAARSVAAAPDLPTAGGLAARLGRACSQCHEARAAVVTFAWDLAPPNEPALAAQMKLHQWAAARLWDGLVGPSDALWAEGATALATVQLDTLAAAHGTARGDVDALAVQVHELATRAVNTSDHDARAELYGQLLSTCAGCHALVRPRPVPGK